MVPFTTESESVYRQLGVTPVVNAAGTKTRIGGSLIREEAADAMRAAADEFVQLSDLEAKASEQIAEIAGSEAGYVSPGAEAGLLLAAAAAIAGDDPETMSVLPHPTDAPNDVVMPRTHRTGYDHALRAAGANIVDVGTNDYHLGTGATNVEPWEIESAIDENTAGVAYVQKTYTQPDLSTVSEIAHRHDVPVIVDAAAEVPPIENLSRFVEQGADMVVFSGGKGIRGPQTTGIIAGKRQYIRSIAVQHQDMHVDRRVWNPPSSLIDTERFDGVPRQGIGRSLKVGKEELVGLIRALELFIEEDQEALVAEWENLAENMASQLEAAGVETTVVAGGEQSVAPRIIVDITHSQSTLSAAALVSELQREDPRVYVGEDRIDEGEVVLNPMCLDEDGAAYVVDRLLTHL